MVPKDKDYPYDPNDGRKDNRDTTGIHRVLRGGGWDSLPQEARSTNRLIKLPQYEDYLVGFRCARDFYEGDLN
jgi:formylglycine-generating enzyme required for sulfatase activity